MKKLAVILTIVACLIGMYAIYKCNPAYVAPEYEVIRLQEEVDSLKVQNARLEERVRELESNASKVEDLEADLEDAIRFLNDLGY